MNIKIILDCDGQGHTQTCHTEITAHLIEYLNLKALKSKPSIVTLELDNAPSDLLGTILQSLSGMQYSIQKELHITNSTIDDETAEIIATMLKQSPKLRLFSLRGSMVTDSKDHIITAINSKAHLETVDITEIKAEPSYIQRLNHAIDLKQDKPSAAPPVSTVKVFYSSEKKYRFSFFGLHLGRIKSPKETGREMSPLTQEPTTPAT